MKQEVILKTEHLKKSYENGNPVLKDLNFSLEKEKWW